ncbi:fimbrial protein [Xenorhabdus littoralis]|uniref:fimbrial protein n=1 Tax=Xenorhabdus littoralis TaxID=2582835 RepID=UPI0029E7FF0D|nr:fimbrial protein [Xenorhabdus sp. psl]MDX7991025.1 type 1 fimbrial protein [Xenorhabdus sp. psl]
MKINKLAIVLGFGVALTAGAANAAPTQGHGTVKFTGSIIDAPCSIKNNNITVDMGQVSNVALKDGRESASKHFTIELEDCEMNTLKSVKTTFNGQEADGPLKGLLAIQGGAKGAAIMITNHDNRPILLGKESAATLLHDGSNALNFAAHLKGLQGTKSKDSNTSVKSGEFTAIANFTLSYL